MRKVVKLISVVENVIILTEHHTKDDLPNSEEGIWITHLNDLEVVHSFGAKDCDLFAQYVIL